MSKATVYNLRRHHLTPKGELVISRPSDSMVTARMEFQCVSGDERALPIQTLLDKGTPIESLYPDIGSVFSFLYVDTSDSRAQAGGYTIVEVIFKGVDIGDDSQFEGKDVTYTRNNSLSEDSIFDNENFIDTVEAYTRNTIRLATEGIVYAPDESAPYDFRYIKDDSEREEITDEAAIYWADYIITQKNHTYLRPTSEWTKSATGKSKLRPEDLANMRYIDTPPGDPTAPGDDVWLFTGATENIIKQGDGANSYSLTWTSGNWPAPVYQKDYSF